MENEKQELKGFNEDEFFTELSDLLKKHNLKNCVFAGENEDDKMIGLFCIERHGMGCNAKDVINSSLNAARLYQASREKIFYTLDKYFK